MPLHTERYKEALDTAPGAFNEVLTGARVLTLAEVRDNKVLNLDANGATRTVDLPQTHASIVGRHILINNTAAGAFALTVRLTGGGATVVSVPQNKMAWLLCWGAAAGQWRGLSA